MKKWTQEQKILIVTRWQFIERAEEDHSIPRKRSLYYVPEVREYWIRLQLKLQASNSKIWTRIDRKNQYVQLQSDYYWDNVHVDAYSLTE